MCSKWYILSASSKRRLILHFKKFMLKNIRKANIYIRKFSWELVWEDALSDTELLGCCVFSGEKSVTYGQSFLRTRLLTKQGYFFCYKVKIRLFLHTNSITFGSFCNIHLSFMLQNEPKLMGFEL